MKRKIIYVLVLLLTGHIIFYAGFRLMSAKRSELVVKLNEYKKLDKPFDVLILGDSHVERGVDFSQIPGVISLAYYGENNVMNYYRLKYCVENCKNKFKYVVLSCDVITFSKGFNAFRTNKFFYYSLIPFSELDNFEANPLNAKYECIKSRIFPYAEWQYGLNIWESERIQKGLHTFSDKTEAEKMKNARYFVQTEMACAGKKENLFYATALDYLQKTIDYCKQNNIKPIFVRYPLTQQVFDVVKNEIDSTVFNLDNRPSEMILRDNQVPVLDFEYLYAQRPDLFFDCHHLNNAGKAAFTPVFKEKLESLLKLY